MKFPATFFILASIVLLAGCHPSKDKYAAAMYTTDSLQNRLDSAFKIYNTVDTNAVNEIYQELLKTEKYAGLAFDFQAIDKLKTDIKLTMKSDRLIRKQYKITIARLKALKQSLRHNEHSEFTFSTQLNQAKKEVDDLSNFEAMIAGKLNSWANNKDSTLSSLRK